jgi:hypothetical protein
MAKKVLNKKELSSANRTQYHLKLVTSDVCEVCKKQCSAGIRYMEFMRIPGHVGRGVPCILTRSRK